MSKSFLRVAKVGGSLFNFEQLPTALRTWLELQPGLSVLIAGAGPMADFVRTADTTFQLGEATSHQLSLGTMRVSAELLAAILPESRIVVKPKEVWQLVEKPTMPPLVFDAGSCLARANHAGTLPCSWEATSDSIAAHVCGLLEASELVLFKSCELPPNTTREQASAKGLVDAYFARAAEQLPAIRWVNLRSDPVTERPL